MENIKFVKKIVNRHGVNINGTDYCSSKLLINSIGQTVLCKISEKSITVLTENGKEIIDTIKL